MSKWQTYRDKKSIPIMCGTYVVYSKGKVIYVGVSKNVRKRFSKHTSKIDGWDLLKIKPASSFGAAYDVEAKLIRRIQPKNNSYGAPRGTLSTRPRISIKPELYQRFKTFCLSRNLIMKEIVNDLVDGFLEGASNAK